MNPADRARLRDAALQMVQYDGRVTYGEAEFLAKGVLALLDALDKRDKAEALARTGRKAAG